MALAECTHRASRDQTRAREEARHATHCAPRGPKTLRGRGQRLRLRWPGPQEVAVTVGYVAAAEAPLLAVASLGGGDAVEDTSVGFLLETALKTPEGEGVLEEEGSEEEGRGGEEGAKGAGRFVLLEEEEEQEKASSLA